MSMTLDRRDFLRGMAALPMALRLPSLPRRGGPAVILVWLDGGMSHVDTFDGKPEAPAEVRGDMRFARAAVDGVFVSDHLPGLGERMDRVALIRSITHGEGNHDRGSHLWLTGHRPSPVLVHPALGAQLAFDADPDDPLPPYVAIPGAPEYGGGGFLPRVLDPFSVGGDPGRPDFRVPGLQAPADRTRVEDLVDEIDRLGGPPRGEDEELRDRLLRRARAMSADPEVRALFDLSRVDASERQRYGRDRLGQSVLLARRLVEGGVRTVLVRDVGWDHHVRVHDALTFGYPPKLTALDGALSALLDDLRERDGLQGVTVCVASEFGRTPTLNPAGGRDHWPRAQSALLFGHGIRSGAVHGTTDARGEEPATDPVSPADVWATLLAAQGVDLGTVRNTLSGRPVRLVPEGASPIRNALESL